MSELINKLNQYRSMGDKFYPEDIVVIEDIWVLIDEIERLHSIIKEVREYIKDNAYWAEETEDGDFVSGKLLHDDDIKYIEELLNKGSDKE